MFGFLRIFVMKCLFAGLGTAEPRKDEVCKNDAKTTGTCNPGGQWKREMGGMD